MPERMTSGLEPVAWGIEASRSSDGAGGLR